LGEAGRPSGGATGWGEVVTGKLGLDLAGDLRRVFVEDEMVGVEPDELCVRQVVDKGRMRLTAVSRPTPRPARDALDLVDDAAGDMGEVSDAPVRRTAAKNAPPGPRWVKSGKAHVEHCCPLVLPKRTLIGGSAMSA
jgi:hypothetical protein